MEPQEREDLVRQFVDEVVDYFCLEELTDVSAVEAFDMTRFVMGFAHPLIPEVSRRVEIVCRRSASATDRNRSC